MPTTATYTVNNPTNGTEYVAPSAYWVIPNSGTQVKCTVQAFDGNGNLLQVNQLFAYNWDQTTSANKSSFSGNFNTVNTATSQTNGSDIFAPAGKVTANGVSSIKMYLTYTGSAYDQPPNAPSSLSPTGGAITTLTPTFTGNFTDPDAGDTLYQYEIILNSAANGGGSQVWDSGIINASGTEITNAAFSKVYSGPALTGGQTYSWKARAADQKGTFGVYSGWQNFTPGQGPNAPSSVIPTGQQTTLTPAFHFTYTHPTPLNQQSYHYTITAQVGGATVYDSGTIALNVATGSVVSGTIPGAAGLQNGAAYNFNVFCTDTNSTSGPTTTVAFSIAPLPTGTPASPINNATVNSQQPTFTWSYSDPNYTQAQYELQFNNSNTGALLWDTGLVGSAGTSFTLANVANPAGAPTLSATGSGSPLLAGTYTVGYTWKTALGETQLSPTQTVVLALGQKIHVAALTLPANVASVNYYVSIAANNATTAFAVNGSGAAIDIAVLGTSPSPPGANTSGVIPFNTFIKWRIRVIDSAALDGGFSAYAFFQVQSVPTAVITAPTNGSTITTNTPTIQWTYTASSGGQPQASALVQLLDANNNPLTSYTVNGAGTTFSLPAGVLVNNTTYHLKVSVTDTISQTGTSSIISFTLQYTPPADMQGQPLANGKNWLLGPHFLFDTNADGVGDNWITDNNGPVGGTGTYSYSMDPAQVQLWQQPSGDGPYQGAQVINLVSMNGANTGQIRVRQDIDITIPGWVAGSTHLSIAAWAKVAVAAGTPIGFIQVDYFTAGNVYISSDFGTGQGDTAGQIVQISGPQNSLIPATTRFVHVLLCLACSSVNDVGTVWYMGGQLEAAAASDANFIAGDLGTGYSFDANGFSVRSNLAGNLPALIANPGADSDPISAPGGTITLTWDTTLADATRFTSYLIERRRMDQQTSDSAWVLLTTITNKLIGRFTDYTCGGGTAYQYSVRQTIQFASGDIGISAHRAIAVASVIFAPAWYLTNAQGTIYNWRLDTTGPKRKLTWNERAVYNDFLGRVGTARDAGPDAGYEMQMEAYVDDSFGDDHEATRRQLVVMQQLNVVWYLRAPTGLVIPVHLSGWDIDQEYPGTDLFETISFDFKQASATNDY
jgi:hypothetical protein